MNNQEQDLQNSMSVSPPQMQPPPPPLVEDIDMISLTPNCLKNIVAEHETRIIRMTFANLLLRRLRQTLEGNPPIAIKKYLNIQEETITPNRKWEMESTGVMLELESVYYDSRNFIEDFYPEYSPDRICEAVDIITQRLEQEQYVNIETLLKKYRMALTYANLVELMKPCRDSRPSLFIAMAYMTNCVCSGSLENCPQNTSPSMAILAMDAVTHFYSSTTFMYIVRQQKGWENFVMTYIFQLWGPNEKNELNQVMKQINAQSNRLTPIFLMSSCAAILIPALIIGFFMPKKYPQAMCPFRMFQG